MALPKIGGSRLLEHIDRVGLTQVELADRLGVSKSFISQVISGNARFSLERSYHAALILGCTIEDLYYWIY